MDPHLGMVRAGRVLGDATTVMFERLAMLTGSIDYMTRSEEL